MSLQERRKKTSPKSQFNEIKKMRILFVCVSCHLKWNSLHVVKCIRWMTSSLAVYKYSRHLYHSIRFPMASFTPFWIHIKKHHSVQCNIFTLRALFDTHTASESHKGKPSNGWCKRFRGNNILQHSFFRVVPKYECFALDSRNWIGRNLFSSHIWYFRAWEFERVFNACSIELRMVSIKRHDSWFNLPSTLCSINLSIIEVQWNCNLRIWVTYYHFGYHMPHNEY